MTGRICVLGVTLLVSAATPAAAQMAVQRFAIAGGGATSSAGPYTVSGTAGQAEAGSTLSGGAYGITGGFWTVFETEPCSIALLPATLANGAAGSPYPSATLTQTGGVGTMTFAITSGALPAGMSMTSAGVVSGTPTVTGSFTFTVTATAANGCTGSRAYTLTIAVATRPTMILDTRLLIFGAESDGAAFRSQTSAQLVRLIQNGAGTVTWTATTNQPWLTVSPASGGGSATLSVNVSFVSGLAATQHGSVTVTFSGTDSAAGVTPVTLNILPAGSATAPNGAFDTPLDGSTGVAGSIAVTGWAVDDIEVTRVRVLRDPVAGEPAGQLVFIGNAVLVDGARPDIQAAFPAVPRYSRGGWGYLMLTNFLPNIGNGTFRLHAIADDADGHSTVLGSKTITCTNSASTAPFGAIDTPGQGDVIAGTAYPNFGWVLSPGARRADPTSGGIVSVLVDGQAMGQPGGWVSRDDLTGAFPVASFSGVGSALGVYALDTTQLTNGVHTIAWIVTDNMGAAAGVGSRYFTVSNGSGLLLEPAQARHNVSDRSAVIAAPATVSVPKAAAQRIGSTGALADEVNSAPVSAAAIRGRRGFGQDAGWRVYGVSDGVATMQAEELDRIELRLDRVEGQRHSLYLRVPGGLAPLPVGSSFDESTGVFIWQPGVAFVGEYDFVFVRWSGGRVMRRHEVRIVLNPKGGIVR